MGAPWDRQQSEVGSSRGAGLEGQGLQGRRGHDCGHPRSSDLPCPPFQGQDLLLHLVAAAGSSRWSRNLAPRKVFPLSRLKLASFLFHSLSCLPGSAFQMTAMWPPFWCQVQRRRPEAGCPGRDDLERWLFINSPCFCSQTPAGSREHSPRHLGYAGFWPPLGSGRGAPACAGLGWGWWSTLPLQAHRGAETEPGLLSDL